MWTRARSVNSRTTSWSSVEFAVDHVVRVRRKSHPADVLNPVQGHDVPTAVEVSIRCAVDSWSGRS